MAIFRDLKIPLGKSLETILKQLDPDMRSYKIHRKSIDARKKSNIVHVYTIETSSEPENFILEDIKLESYSSSPQSAPITLIIGAGPAGLFAALRLIARGLPCMILDRGKALNPRMKDIANHWRRGIIDEDSNVCFGEGGAGCFSDGKLITRIKSPFKNYVMQEFVRFGAPRDILYLSNPHVGSNKIRTIIRNLICFLEAHNCSVLFNSKVSDFVLGSDNSIKEVVLSDNRRFQADNIILATGHSAHDIYKKLFELNVPMEAKSMAMGFRIEHPQKWLNIAQYGEHHSHPELPTASYRITYQDKVSESGVYSFCMCPGGYVLASSAQKNHMVVNGMSNYNHGSPFANSGIVVSIDKKKWYPEGPTKALDFQTRFEKKAYELTQKSGFSIKVPAQTTLSFLNNIKPEVIRSSCPSGVIATELSQIYPAPINDALKASLEDFERKMPGFLSKDSQLHGIESRTSSPIRILRNEETMTSPQIRNLYPVGEGAGYAGGITSAAVDGIRAAEAIFLTLPAAKHV